MDKLQKVEVQILNAFVDDERGGNPAGVVLNADHLTNEQKLKVAEKVGLSETAFVSKSRLADFKLDFFTPTRQIAHCGHATIAAFSYLSQLGMISNNQTSKETIDGTRDILLRDGLAFMEQRPPLYSDVQQKQEKVLKSLGLTEYDLIANAPILIINTGNSFAIIPVSSSAILKGIEPDYDLITQISEEFDLIGYYVFCLQTEDEERDANTRMFAPRYGIYEEAGTGMAAGPLACYLHDILDLKKGKYLIQQGLFMKIPSPSLIIVELQTTNGKISKILAGGKGTVRETFIIEI